MNNKSLRFITSSLGREPQFQKKSPPGRFLVGQNKKNMEMKKALKEMHRQVGDLVVDEREIAVRGLYNGSQYHPCYRAFKYPQIARRITSQEYSKSLQLAQKAGLKRLHPILLF